MVKSGNELINTGKARAELIGGLVAVTIIEIRLVTVHIYYENLLCGDLFQSDVKYV